MNLKMYNKISQIIFIILIFIVGCNISSKKEDPVKNNNQTDTLYSVNLDINRFPINFSIIDWEILFDALPGIIDRPDSKGEFETTEEFQNRVKKFDEQIYKIPLVSDLTIDSLFTIDLENANTTYDADNLIMNIGIYLGINPDWHTSNGLPEDTYDRMIYEKSSFIHLRRDNIPGSTRKIFLFTNHKEFSNKSRLIVPLNMERDYAQQEKENIKVLSTIKLVKPWLWRNYNRYLGSVKCMFGEIIQIWIFNSKTGEIYKKITPVK